MKKLVSIILPTINEKENIKQVITQIIKNVVNPLEIIVVDDNSTDGTINVVKSLKRKEVKIISRKKIKGLASSIIRGIMESEGEIIGWMDADMSMDPSNLPKMIDLLKKHEVVIGSRYVKGGADIRPKFRTLASEFVNKSAALVLGGNIKDYDSGFVVMRRNVLDNVNLYVFPEGYGSYFIEFVYDCIKKGIDICEFPYQFKDRTMGKSKATVSFSNYMSTGIKYLFRIIYLRFRS